MSRQNTMFRLAAILLLLSAGLHLLGMVLSSFDKESHVFLPVIAFYAVMSLLLWRGWRPVAYIAFICMLIGAIGSWIASGGINRVPTWVYHAIAMTDVACAVGLFATLWQDRKPSLS